MKIKEIERTANVAWSPAAHYPIYLAAGTAAQQLDATFSTTASLELYHLDLSDTDKHMKLAGSIETDSRFYKLLWGAYGLDHSDDNPLSGLLLGGAEQGQLYVWDTAKIISNDSPLVHKFDKHSGPVASLDANPFQTNLIASGASDSEIFIWDLNNPEKPMTPGAKAQPLYDVTCLTWNQQVQHILASSHGGSCIVWDLRKNEPIIKIRDSMSHIKCNAVCWHPDIATQLCMASEDDHTPVIQLWDLRSATSPVKILEHHSRGILSLAWCSRDPDLLLSSGKDNHILCWNPNSDFKNGEIVYELPTGQQWCFDVQWCPRNPSVISSCSFDGYINLYSIVGNAPASRPNASAAVASNDPFAQPHTLLDSVEATALKKPPKWMRRPAGASFAFGGKLVSFGNAKPTAGHHQQQQQHAVHISQVVTEVDVVNRSSQLEQTLTNKQYMEFCNLKIAQSKDASESTVWNFLKANFEQDPRQEFLTLLGYSMSDVKEKVESALGKEDKTDSNEDSEFNLSVKSEKSHRSSPFDDLVVTPPSPSPLPIVVNNDCDGLITQALLTANFEAAVDVCLQHDRMADALLLAIAGGGDLLSRTQKAYFERNKSNVSQLMRAILMQNFESIIHNCQLNNWREALAIILTYTAGKEFSSLCNQLGKRLESESDEELASNANICYIVAGNVELLVESWSKSVSAENYFSLQDLVEKVMILKNGVEGSVKQCLPSSSLADRLCSYANLLASQGCLQTAINYLSSANTEDRNVVILTDRLSKSLGVTSNVKSAFQPVNVLPDVSKKSAFQPQPSAAAAVSSAPAPAPAPAAAATAAGRGAFAPGPTAFAPGPTAFAPVTPTHGTYDRDMDRNYVTNGHVGQVGVSQVGPSAGYKSRHVSGGMVPGYDNIQQPVPDVSNPALYNTYQPYSSNPYSQPAYGTPYNPNVVPSGPAVTNNVMPTYQPPAGAWNDPPVVKDSTKKAAVDQQPIMQQFEGKFLNPADYAPVLPVQQPHLPHSSPMGPMVPQMQQPQQPQPDRRLDQVPQQPVDQRASSAPQKPSIVIPAEHKVLQDVLSQLVGICFKHATQNIQMKRKLDDVTKKLDILYERLFNGVLSGNTLNGLHQIVQAIQQYDYQTALAYHAQLVSTGSFTEISPFMPGIKVLIQTAFQLQVYI